MSQDSNPYVREFKTQRLQDIVTQFEHEDDITTAALSLADAKRVELMKKMKEDTDKKEYMIMLNAIVILAAVVLLTHFIIFNQLMAIVCMLIILAFFVFVRRRLTMVTLQLPAYKSDFDKYLWEGFHLKEMRYSAVKLSYLVFFPLIVVFGWDIVMGYSSLNGLWSNFLIALAISTMGWLVFFYDDKTILEGIEVDLKALEYM